MAGLLNRPGNEICAKNNNFFEELANGKQQNVAIVVCLKALKLSLCDDSLVLLIKV